MHDIFFKHLVSLGSLYLISHDHSVSPRNKKITTYSVITIIPLSPYQLSIHRIRMHKYHRATKRQRPVTVKRRTVSLLLVKKN